MYPQELGEAEVSVPITQMRDTVEFSFQPFDEHHGWRTRGQVMGPQSPWQAHTWTERGHSSHRAVSAADMDIPLPDEVLRRGGRLTHVLGKPQGCPEDRTAHLELQPRHGSFW